MARNLSVAKNTYTKRSYGPFTINGFTRVNADYMRVTMAVDGTWPLTQDRLFTLTCEWMNNAQSVAKVVYTVVGDQRRKDGSLPSSVEFKFNIPKDGEAKSIVNSARVSVEVDQTFDTAVAVDAV